MRFTPKLGLFLLLLLVSPCGRAENNGPLTLLADEEEDFFSPKVQSQAEGLAQLARIVAQACERRSLPPRLGTPDYIPFPFNYVSTGKKSREVLSNLDTVEMSGFFDFEIKGGGYLSAESLSANAPAVLEPIFERREYRWKGKPFARLNAQIRGQALALYFLEVNLDEARSKLLYSWRDGRAHPLFMKWGRRGHVETTAVMIVVVPNETVDSVVAEAIFWNTLESALPANSAFPRGRMHVPGYPRPFGSALIPDWLYDTLHFERLLIGL